MQVAIGERRLHASPHTELRQTRVPMLDPSPSGSTATPRGQPNFIFQKCWHCEPAFGKCSAICEAISVLESLKQELNEAKMRVEDEEAEAGVCAATRKAARYFMYRKWVGEKWGFLGRGSRIRIPPCVVEYIRNEFREPDCKCLVRGPLFACVVHGYTGGTAILRERNRHVTTAIPFHMS